MRDVIGTWAGFRGFREETQIRMPRITLLIGRNNVGKTSAYLPLLLLKQTLGARSPDTALLSRGELVDAGPFRDYVTGHDRDLPVKFRLQVPDIRSDGFWITDLEFRSTDGQNAFLAHHRVQGPEKDQYVSRRRDRPLADFTVTSPMLPTKQAIGRPTREVTDLRSAMRSEQPRGFLIEGFGGLMLPRAVREDSNRWEKVRHWYSASYDLFDMQQTAKNSLESFLQEISYLGPLRSLGQRTYQMAAEAPTDVGGVGEHAPEVLYRQRDSHTGHLVGEWLSRLGYGQLHFERLNDEYFQLQMRRKNGDTVNLADSGVGLSQILPLLLQAALSRPTSTLIAQQPEIHLNPAQQTQLTDILIERAAAGTRLVIETHSEHVLLRLRLRIAEGDLDASEVAIYFADQAEGATHLVPVKMGSRAEINRSAWPSGFFEEQLHDSFALAVAQSTKTSRE